MYLNFFGLEARPFHTTPDPYFLYLSPSHKQALGSIIYGVKEKKGFIAVTGQVGLGKTTILRSFLAQIDQANQHTIYLLNPNLSFTSVLKTLLRELEHDPIEGDDAELVEQLHMVLIEEYQKGKMVVLLIDEAQNIPVATLEHLRMLSNLETPKDKLIQIVLLGQPELDSLLDRYELRQIRQRIAVRAMIRPLSQQESVQYIQHRLDKAGGEGKKFFTNSALGLIVQEAKGIPRRLNILCDNALVTAFGYKKSPVTGSMAKEVISDLTSQPSHSLWRLVPLAAGVLILVLALVALMPLTLSKFSDLAPLDEIGKLIDQADNPKQDLLVEKDTNPSDQGGLTLVERAQNWLTASVPEVLEELGKLTISDPDSNMTHPNLEVDIALENQGDVVPAKNPMGDGKESVPVVSEEPLDLAAPETAAHLIHSHQKEAPHPPDQSEGIVTNEVQRSTVEKTQVVQVESEAPTDYAIDMNAVYPNPENLNNLSVETTAKTAETQESLPEQEILPPITAAKKLVTLQEFPSKKPDVVASSLLVAKIMKEGDTLAGLMQEVYGSASPSTLRFVLDHNRHIVNVRKIYPGQQILFPPLNNGGSPKRPVDGASALVSNKGEKLSYSKKIVTGSSAQTKPNQEKFGAKRDPMYAVAIVQEGDTLEKLAKVVYGSSDPLYIQRVLDYNPQILNPKEIFPGQDIAFPRMVEEVKDPAYQSSQANSLE